MNQNQYIPKDIHTTDIEATNVEKWGDKKASIELLGMLLENFPYPYCIPRVSALTNARYILNVLFLYKLITKEERDEILSQIRVLQKKSKKEKKRVAN